MATETKRRRDLRTVIKDLLPRMQAEEKEGGRTSLSLLTDSVEEVQTLFDDLDRLEAWISDMQTGLNINCVYCGHVYGPGDDPDLEAGTATMQEKLRAHIETCPRHPMSALVKEHARAHREVASVIDCLEHTGCVVRCCEGGGPEDVFGTLAITCAKLAGKLEYQEIKENRETVRPLNIAVVYAAAKFLDLEVPQGFPSLLSVDQLDQVIELYLGWYLLQGEDRDRFVAECAPDFLKRAAALFAEGFDVCDLCGKHMATRKIGGEDNLDVCDLCHEAEESQEDKPE